MRSLLFYDLHIVQTKSPSKVENIYRIFEEKIVGGVWPVGLCIPTELELAAEFGCGRNTITKVLTRLLHEGLVERRKRVGTRVIRNSPSRGKRTVELDAFAFIYPSEQHDGVRRIAQGFQEAAHGGQRRVVMLSTGMNFHQEGEIIGRLDEFDVKGAVVYPVLPKAEDRLYFAQMLLACRFPVVLADITLPGFNIHSVAIDNFHAGYTMTRHLLARGLRKIGFLANCSWAPSVQNRYKGYCWALEEAGIEEQLNWTLMEPSLEPDFAHPLEKMQTQVELYLKSSGGLEGVLCYDDYLALNCLISARRLGLSVPRDLKVVGLGDYSASALSMPPLTTYHFPFEQIGMQAFQILNNLLQGKTNIKTEIQVRGNIVLRKSA